MISKKRRAEGQITRDGLEEEESPSSSIGSFNRASSNEMANRTIFKPNKKKTTLPPPVAEEPAPKKNPFANFTGFVTKKSGESVATKPTTTTTTAKPTTTTTSKSSQPKGRTLATLNRSMASWLEKQLKENPSAPYREGVEDYIRYASELGGGSGKAESKGPAPAVRVAEKKKEKEPVLAFSFQKKKEERKGEEKKEEEKKEEPQPQEEPEKEEEEKQEQPSSSSSNVVREEDCKLLRFLEVKQYNDQGEEVQVEPKTFEWKDLGKAKVQILQLNPQLRTLVVRNLAGKIMSNLRLGKGTLRRFHATKPFLAFTEIVRDEEGKDEAKQSMIKLRAAAVRSFLEEAEK